MAPAALALLQQADQSGWRQHCRGLQMPKLSRVQLIAVSEADGSMPAEPQPGCICTPCRAACYDSCGRLNAAEWAVHTLWAHLLALLHQAAQHISGCEQC